MVPFIYYAAQGGSNFWFCKWNPSVTTQMKATEQYFPVVLFIMLYKVVLTFESVDRWNPSVTTQMKATEEYFPGVLLICLHWEVAKICAGNKNVAEIQNKKQQGVTNVRFNTSDSFLSELTFDSNCNHKLFYLYSYYAVQYCQVFTTCIKFLSVTIQMKAFR